MEKRIKFFGEDEECKELFRLVVLVKVDKNDTDEDIKRLKKELSDFYYERIQDGNIRAVMKGQYLTLANKIRKLELKGYVL